MPSAIWTTLKTNNIRIIGGLNEVQATAWNALNYSQQPFLSYEFLQALEEYGCVGEHWGWLPQHLLIEENGTLVGAMPLYLKTNSYGELVFDWSWADAYARAGLQYYPKLVSAIPYTPVTGERMLVSEHHDTHDIRDQLIHAALTHARQLEVSSLHILFPVENELDDYKQHGMLQRDGCQFHWFNNHYASFDDFLATFSAQKRKKVKRERRHVSDAQVRIEILDGHAISEAIWQAFHALYCSTFMRKSGYATLSLDFFLSLSERMPDRVRLIMASHQNDFVAGAYFLCDDNNLYGRHWGCKEHFHSLHFEVCYYSAIEYCIATQRQHFDAGAQGEHKISRGFRPVPTYSVHWLSHPAFMGAVADFVAREAQGVAHYRDALADHLPYKKQDD